MTITEAVSKGIGKLAKPQWRSAHVELYLIRNNESPGRYGEPPPGEGDFGYGPWMRLYDPPSHLALGLPWNHFYLVPSFFSDDTDWVEWVEPADYQQRFAAQTPAPPMPA